MIFILIFVVLTSLFLQMNITGIFIVILIIGYTIAYGTF